MMVLVWLTLAGVYGCAAVGLGLLTVMVLSLGDGGSDRVAVLVYRVRVLRVAVRRRWRVVAGRVRLSGRVVAARWSGYRGRAAVRVRPWRVRLAVRVHSDAERFGWWAYRSGLTWTAQAAGRAAGWPVVALRARGERILTGHDGRSARAVAGVAYAVPGLA